MDNTILHIFVSCFGTVLSVSKDGRLYHAFPEEIEPNLFCDISGNIIKYPANFLEASDIRTVFDGGYFCLRSKDGFLCSDIGGAIGWRQHCLEMEKFTIKSMNDYAQLKKEAYHFPKIRKSFHIKKVIHQTHDEKNIPNAFIASVEKLRTLNPNWEYIYWNAQDRLDFIYTYYGYDILEKYLKINPRYGAARADLFRYLCLYKLGGAYLDIKSSSNNAFDSFVHDDDHYLISQWRNKPGEIFDGCGLGPEVSSIDGGEYQQWNIISENGHPFLEAVINNVLARIGRYRENYYGSGKLSVLRVTGPYVYTMTISSLLEKFSHRFFDSYQSGLIYSDVDNYVKFFKNHYSNQNTPLIL